MDDLLETINAQLARRYALAKARKTGPRPTEVPDPLRSDVAAQLLAQHAEADAIQVRLFALESDLSRFPGTAGLPAVTLGVDRDRILRTLGQLVSAGVLSKAYEAEFLASYSSLALQASLIAAKQEATMALFDKMSRESLAEQERLRVEALGTAPRLSLDRELYDAALVSGDIEHRRSFFAAYCSVGALFGGVSAFSLWLGKCYFGSRLGAAAASGRLS